MEQQLVSPLAFIPFLMGIDYQAGDQVSGRVEFYSNSLGVGGIIVTLSAERASTGAPPSTVMTDSEGAFTFAGVAKGNYQLSAEYKSVIVKGPRIKLPRDRHTEHVLTIPLLAPEPGHLIQLFKQKPIGRQYEHNFDFTKVILSPCPTDGLLNDAYSFSSADDAFSFPWRELQIEEQDFTIAVWVNFRVPRRVGVLSRGTCENGFELTIAENLIEFTSAVEGKPVASLGWRSEKPISDGKCHLIEIALTRKLDKVTLFVDNDSNEKASVCGPIPANLEGAPFFIGKGWSDPFPAGMIADPRVIRSEYLPQK